MSDTSTHPRQSHLARPPARRVLLYKCKKKRQNNPTREQTTLTRKNVRAGQLLLSSIRVWEQREAWRLRCSRPTSPSHRTALAGEPCTPYTHLRTSATPAHYTVHCILLPTRTSGRESCFNCYRHHQYGSALRSIITYLGHLGSGMDALFCLSSIPLSWFVPSRWVLRLRSHKPICICLG